MAHAKSTDPNVFILPDLGEGVHEAELIAWKVQPGDTVEEHQIIAEMETDKALVEVPSPRAGTIKQLHGAAGEILHVGNPLVTYESEGDADANPQQPQRATDTTSVEPAAAEAVENADAAQEDGDAGTVVGSMSGEMPGVRRDGKALAAPAVRRLARDLGVDIDAVAGTGIGGRVTAKDVRAAAEGVGAARNGRHAPAPSARSPQPEPKGSAAPAEPARPAPRAEPPRERAVPQGPAFAPGEESTRTPVRGVRRTIATRLRRSVDTAVHFTVMDEADVSALDRVRKRIAAASGEKVSFLPFVCSAVARVLTGRFGALNATVEEAGEEMAIVTHRAVHLGIAADTDNGLMVPVVRDADRLGLLQIGREVARVAEGARSRSLSRDELSGSTFTISNVGSHAGRFATPVINAPEVGILAVGRTREGPVVRGGMIGVGKLMPLSLACDHRVVDGATAALALAEIVRLLQDEPEALLEPARG